MNKEYEHIERIGNQFSNPSTQYKKQRIKLFDSYIEGFNSDTEVVDFVSELKDLLDKYNIGKLAGGQIDNQLRGKEIIVSECQIIKN